MMIFFSDLVQGVQNRFEGSLTSSVVLGQAKPATSHLVKIALNRHKYYHSFHLIFHLKFSASFLGDCADFDYHCGLTAFPESMCATHPDIMEKFCPKLCKMCSELILLITSNQTLALQQQMPNTRSRLNPAIRFFT